MKFSLIVFLIFSFSFLSAQSLVKTKYSNMGSRTFDIGISKNLGNDDLILHLVSGTRYRIINIGTDLSSTMGDSLFKINNLYLTFKSGLGIPVFHSKYSTTTLNVNGTINLAKKEKSINSDEVGIWSKFGFEAYARFNTPYAIMDIGYIGTPNHSKKNLYRKGVFVKLGIGLNEFFSRKKGWNIKNINKDPFAIELKKGDKVQGTGFALSENGLIVTNYHVIKDSRKIKVLGVNGNMKKEIDAEVLLSDKDADITVLKIKKQIDSIPFLYKIKESLSGKNIYTLGYPKYNVLGSNIKITEGIINSTTGIKDDNTVYQISAPITNGNSGGPLFDEYGNIIGITSSGYRDKSSDLVNYAIKISEMIPLLEKISDKIDIQYDYNKESVDASKISYKYGKFVYIIVAEH